MSLREAFDAMPTPAGIASVTSLPDNPGAWAARWRRLGQAQTRIDASYFIVEEDVFGVAFLGRLYERARAGVSVRLIIDARGSIPVTSGVVGRDYLQEMVRVGADVHVFNPPLPAVLRALGKGNVVPLTAGTHNKTLVIDEREAITGGRNIATAYFASPVEAQRAFFDFDVVLEGREAAAAMRASLMTELAASWGGGVDSETLDLIPRGDELLMVAAAMDAWLSGQVSILPTDLAALELEEAAVARLPTAPEIAVRERARPRLRQLAERTELWGALRRSDAAPFSAEVRMASRSSRTRGDDDALNAALARCIGAAQKTILIESPSFVLTPRLLTTLRSAAARGVAIDVITNSAQSADDDFAQSLFIQAVPELLALIPTLRVFVPNERPALHAKRMVIDADLVLVGTYNVDPFSTHLNSETMVGLWSPEYNAATRVMVEARRAGFLEYVAQRDTSGKVNRFPSGHPYAGEVVMVFGPRDHVPVERAEHLRNIRHLMVSVRNMWDFEVVTFETGM
jgi:putative cardiolipin synthase